ncbi:hypothetical protein [Caproicibacterium sp. XB2]|uniref:hypothetical protein n=1 Tax=Caproicibacterium sp. XB2 TaxID=3388458 RepID=UPI00384E6C4E
MKSNITGMSKDQSVAPYTGAWIEIAVPLLCSTNFLVAPYTGAWIEIMMAKRLVRQQAGRSLHGSVD